MISKQPISKQSVSMQQLDLFKELIKHEFQLCEKMLEVLNEEYDNLKNRNLDTFDEVLQRKQGHASTLEAHEKKFFEFIKSTGYEQSSQGVDRFIKELSQSKEKALISQWEKLKVIIKQCQQQNQVNGRIINVSMISNQQLLNVLHGRDSSPSLYDNTGKADDNDDSQSLAIA